jgi:hypothetical protein
MARKPTGQHVEQDSQAGFTTSHMATNTLLYYTHWNHNMVENAITAAHRTVGTVSWCLRMRIPAPNNVQCVQRSPYMTLNPAGSLVQAQCAAALPWRPTRLAVDTERQARRHADVGRPGPHSRTTRTELVRWPKAQETAAPAAQLVYSKLHNSHCLNVFSLPCVARHNGFHSTNHMVTSCPFLYNCQAVTLDEGTGTHIHSLHISHICLTSEPKPIGCCGVCMWHPCGTCRPYMLTLQHGPLNTTTGQAFKQAFCSIPT